MSTSSFVRKVVSIPVYAAVLSTFLVACGTVIVKEERRAKGQQSANASGTATAAEQAKRDGDVALVNRGLALTLPAEMPKTVDTVSITLISGAKTEFVPAPPYAPAKGWPCGAYEFQKFPREIFADQKPCSLIGGRPGHIGVLEKHPLASASLAKAATNGKNHGEKAAKKSKKEGPTARVGKGQAVQPVAFVPLHWLDESHPAGSCGFGFGSDLEENENDPLAAFQDSDVGTAISHNTLNYYFGSDQKVFAVEDLEPGTYVVVIELIDSNTGKVIESGETKVVVEAGKVAAANVKLTAVPATTGGVSITVERAPVAPAAK
ncbi:MAG: hypothetical protein FJ146_09510 [Deltaproteobacteria bacterium]|nr:hypothetical protein [Deltaproteobacteria bacterium]